MTSSPTAAASVVGGASARGASHIRRNKPNQDAGAGAVFGQWSMIAVADGHGGEPYFRSDRGSRFSVEAAREAFAALSGEGSASVADLNRLHAGFVELPARIVSAWHRMVASDIQADSDARLMDGDPHVAYGATCIAAAFGPGVSLFVQIGDGDLLAAPAGGDLIKPLPDDQGLEGEQTYSLCHADAVAHFRTKLFEAPHPLATPSFAMASSDGLSKSFAEDSQFFDSGRHWRSFVEQNGMEAACADLENWLAGCSEMGSGDDNTLMMFYKPAAKTPVAETAKLPEIGLSVARATTPPAQSAHASAVHSTTDAGRAMRGRAALGPAPPASVAATNRFGFAALAAAAVLGAALAAGGLYFVLKSRQSATPLTQAPILSPAVPEPKKPAQPVELSVPARPAIPMPRRSKDAPVVVPGVQPLPVVPQAPTK